MQTKIIFTLLGVAGLGVWFLSLWTTDPFIQQEVVGKAFYWARDGAPFLETLFNGNLMDGHLGRFRYVEYLSHALYWNGIRLGLLPRTLYDLSAAVVTLIIIGMLFSYWKRRGLSTPIVFFVVALVLFSSQSYMVIVFHYRHAKYIVSLLLMCLMYFWADRNQTRDLGWETTETTVLVSLGVIGTLTDPYFILMAPVLALSCDLFQSRNYYITKRLLLGIALGGVAVVLLNGIIGPQFSSKAYLVLWKIPNKPRHLLALSNLINWPQLLPEMLLPKLLPFIPRFIIAMTSLLSLLGLWAFLVFKKREKLPFLTAFVLCLPVQAILVLPRDSGHYAGYHGHVIYLLFVMAAAELFFLWKTSLRNSVALLSVLCTVLVAHQFGKHKIYDSWTRSHLGSAEFKFRQDRELITQLREQLKHVGENPIEIRLDYTKVRRKDFPAKYYKTDGPQSHTSVAYNLLPIFFAKERRSGKLKFHLRGKAVTLRNKHPK